MTSSTSSDLQPQPAGEPSAWRTLREQGLSLARAGSWAEASSLLLEAHEAQRRFLASGAQQTPLAEEDAQQLITTSLNLCACFRQLRDLQRLKVYAAYATEFATCYLQHPQLGQVALANIERVVLEPGFGKLLAWQHMSAAANGQAAPLYCSWTEGARAAAAAAGRAVPPQLAGMEEALSEIRARLPDMGDGGRHDLQDVAALSKALGWETDSLHSARVAADQHLAVVLSCACAHSIQAARTTLEPRAASRARVSGELEKDKPKASPEVAATLVEIMSGLLTPAMRGMKDAWGLPVAQIQGSPSAQGPAHTPAASLTVGAAYRHPFVVSSMLGCDWHHTPAGKAMALMAAGHLPPFLLTEANLTGNRSAWIEQLADLGVMIVEGILQFHRREHVRLYYDKACVTAVVHLLQGLGMSAASPNIREVLPVGETLLYAQLAAAVCAGAPKGNKVNTLLSHLLPVFGTSPLFLATGGSLPVEAANTLRQLLGSRDALMSLQEDYRKLLLEPFPEFTSGDGPVMSLPTVWDYLDLGTSKSCDQVVVVDPLGTGAATSLESWSARLRERRTGGGGTGADAAGPQVIIVMDAGDPAPFNLGPCQTHDSVGQVGDSAGAAQQLEVLRSRSRLMSAFQEPHVLHTPLEVNPYPGQPDAALVVVGLSRQDPVHRSTATGGTTWAAGGAWPSAAVPIQVQGEAASTCAFRAGFCGLLLTGLDVRAHSRGAQFPLLTQGAALRDRLEGRQRHTNIPCLVRSLGIHSNVQITACRFSALPDGMCMGVAGQRQVSVQCCSFQGGIYGLSYGALVDDEGASAPEVFILGSTFEDHARYGLQAAGRKMRVLASQCLFKGCMEGAVGLTGHQSKEEEEPRSLVHLGFVVADQCGGYAITGSGGVLPAHDALGVALASLTLASAAAPPSSRAALVTQGAADAQQVLARKGALMFDCIDDVSMAAVLMTRSESSGILLLGCPSAKLMGVIVSGCADWGLVHSYTSFERQFWAMARLSPGMSAALFNPGQDMSRLALEACVLVGNGRAGLWVADVCAEVVLERSAVDALEGPAKGSGGYSGAGRTVDQKAGEEQQLAQLWGPSALHTWLHTVTAPCDPKPLLGSIKYTERPGLQYKGGASSGACKAAVAAAARGARPAVSVNKKALQQGSGTPASLLADSGTLVHLDCLPVMLRAELLGVVVHGMFRRDEGL